MTLLDPSERRRAGEMPERLWARLGLRRGETVVDVGAGSGFYSFPAAARVGPTGHVFAVDVSSDLVELLRSRADEKKVGNLEAVLSTATRIPLEDAVADVAILANLLHGIPSRTVDETIRVLRPGGKLVNVDWKKEPSEGGPAVRHRLSATMARRVLTSHGLAHVDSFDLGPSHYAQVFERPRPVRHPGHLVSAE